jgi:GNAT superfamily N-acetyltransferase
MVDDAPVVADVYRRSWLAGYEGLLDSDELERGAAERGARDWTREITEPATGFGLALVRGSPAGVAKVGPDPTEDVPGIWLDLLYVAPEFWGTGTAIALLRWAVEQGTASGASLMRLRVVEAQGRARRFYEREGWSYDRSVQPRHNGFFPLLCMRSN